MYGHIVAGSPESNVAFIIPASTIRNDIKQRFGSNLTLPQDTNPSKAQDDFQAMKSPPRLTSAMDGDSNVVNSEAKPSSDDGISRIIKLQLESERYDPSLTSMRTT